MDSMSRRPGEYYMQGGLFADVGSKSKSIPGITVGETC